MACLLHQRHRLYVISTELQGKKFARLPCVLDLVLLQPLNMPTCNVQVCIVTSSPKVFHIYATGLLGKSKDQIMKVATLLHALFGIEDEYTHTSTISDAAILAALDLVKVCNEHTKIIAGRMGSEEPTTISCKMFMLT